MSYSRSNLASKIQSCPVPEIELTSHAINWWSKGIEYHQAGDLVQAEACYRRVTRHMPEYVFSLNNLGLLCNTLKRFNDAEQLCRKAIKLQPNYIAAYINLSNTLMSLGNLLEAEKLTRQALSMQPDSIEALCTLGNILTASGRMREAETFLRQALTLKPDSLEIRISLGNVLTQTARFDEAEMTYQSVLRSHPDYVDALNNLGNVLISLNKLHEAKAVLLQAISCQPSNIHALLNLGMVFSSLGQHNAAEARYREALKYKPDFLEAISNLLFMHHYLGENLAIAMQDALQYGSLVQAKAKPFSHTPPATNLSRRLRVGLVSGDLLNHPVGYFLDGVIPFLNTDEVELFVYSAFFREDDLTQRLKEAIPNWRTVVELTDEKLAQLIYSDSIDILIDLSGHTARTRLPMFAWKPAPIQVTWLGYFATTGLTAMDYILGDSINLPKEEANHFIETPWQLPDCYLSFTPPDLPIEVNHLPALTSDMITFGCCNTLKKMTPIVVECWAKILHGVPNSRLFLKCSALADPDMCQTVLEQFAQQHIAPQQLILEGPSSRDNYFAAYHKIDIALDPFPYPGVTTTVEGLWMGVPIITLKGNSFLSHQGESILTNAALTDWIANDIEEYIAKAIQFANNRHGLAILRANLRQQVLHSTLFDTQRFANNLIQAWKDMWRNWCNE